MKNATIRFVGVVVIFLFLSAAITSSADAQNPASQSPVTRTEAAALATNVHYNSGRFNQLSTKTWRATINGKAPFELNEQGRTEWTINLTAPSSGDRYEFNFNMPSSFQSNLGAVRYSPKNGTRVDYPITAATKSPLPVALSTCVPNAEYRCTPNAAISGHNTKPMPNAGSLENCQKACTEETTFVCKSFDFNKSSKACDLSDKTADDVGGLKGDYANNPFDYYERINPIQRGVIAPVTPPTPEIVAYRACESNSEYKCTPNAAISGYNTKSVPTAGSLANCQKLCTEETDFVCKSFDFNKSSKACDLSDKSADDVGGLKTDYSGNPFDYYERIHIPVNVPPAVIPPPAPPPVAECSQISDFECTTNAAIIGHNTKPVQSASLSLCRSMCMTESSFTCRSFDFDKVNGACDLSDKKADSVGGLWTNTRQYDYYQRLFPDEPVRKIEDWQKGNILARDFDRLWDNLETNYTRISFKDVFPPHHDPIGHPQGMAIRDDAALGVVSDLAGSSRYIFTLCASNQCEDFGLGTDQHPGGGIQFLGKVLISSDEENKVRFYDTRTKTLDLKKETFGYLDNIDILKVAVLPCQVPDAENKGGGTAGLGWEPRLGRHVAVVAGNIYISNGYRLDNNKCSFYKVTNASGKFESGGEALNQIFWDQERDEFVAIGSGPSPNYNEIRHQRFKIIRKNENGATVFEAEIKPIKIKKLNVPTGPNSPSFRWAAGVGMYPDGFDVVATARNPDTFVNIFGSRANLSAIVYKARR